MYKKDGTIIYSPSDIITYMRSPFASWMQRLAMEAPEAVAHIEKTQDSMAELLGEKGITHETDYLNELKKQYGEDNVAIIDASPSNGNQSTAAQDTIDAIKSGYKVIFQAYLQRDNFAGYADFLIKREGKSALCDYYYEAWDTKLSKSTRPYFILQLCCYSWMLESIQGVRPIEAAIVLGDKKVDRYTIAGYYHYFSHLKKLFVLNQASFNTDLSNIPDPAFSNSYGQWENYAKQLLNELDSLALVANIRKNQIKKLNAVGIQRLAELAETKLENVKGISPDTFSKLKAQSAIQLRSKGKKKPDFIVIENDNGKGLSALPPTSSLDVYFDIEGHPLMEGGLEYLWGVSYHDENAPHGKDYAFKDWWAHTHAQEKCAFEGFIDWVYQRWQQDPHMHVYHYASYEITAITKVSSREDTRLDVVDELFKHGVFIDLYKMVKNGLLIGEPKYSIKNVEHLYRGQRATEVANGGESIVFYENWREQGGTESWKEDENGYKSWLADPDNFDWSAWSTLDEIRKYNIDDCESTLELVEWLTQQQQKANISYQIPEEEADDTELTERQIGNQEKREALANRQLSLITKFKETDSLKEDSCAELLVSLLHFYMRERKPQIRAYFERLEKTPEELFDDDTVVYEITLTGTQKEDNVLVCTGTYNTDQPVRTDKIKSATIPECDTKITKICFTELNSRQHPHLAEISFVIKPDDEKALQQTPLSFFGDEPRINTETLENRLCEITEDYFETGKLSGALNTILNQANPCFESDSDFLPVTRQRFPDDNDYLTAIIRAIQAMKDTCLCIQGPPGAGKTYTAEHVIEALVEKGKRIGIMSNSHAAIMNLLIKVANKLPNIHVAKVGGYGPKKDFVELYPEEEFPNIIYRTSMTFTKKQTYESFQVIGATAYGFVKDIAHEAPLDYLFVDEASQVALANLLAVSGATTNIILMGDQMQLEQPIQGSHPGQSGSSALEYMLKDHSVIPEDKGIFLERTYRMHPAVCQPLSEVVYEGKLQADANNTHQKINIKKPKHITQENGILSIPVKHEANTQSSEEEANLIQQLISELKTGSFTDKEKKQRPIEDSDIMVIAPYNMQVNLLKEKLSDELNIGTIDKFQGQEAPVVIISMAVSDVNDSPRGLDFIFDKNRLNVAVSRAQALAIIVSNEGLESCQVNNLLQMERVGFFIGLKNV